MRFIQGKRVVSDSVMEGNYFHNRISLIGNIFLILSVICFVGICNKHGHKLFEKEPVVEEKTTIDVRMYDKSPRGGGCFYPPKKGRELFIKWIQETYPTFTNEEIWLLLEDYEFGTDGVAVRCKGNR